MGETFKRVKLSEVNIDKVGWNSITNELKKIYGNNEVYYYIVESTEHSKTIHGIAEIICEDYYHYITYGLSDIFDEDWQEYEGSSGGGLEYTFKLKKECFNEDERKKILEMLLSFSEYAYITGDFLSPYRITNTIKSLYKEDNFDLSALLSVPDSKLELLNTQNGKIRFYSLLGITEEEKILIKEKIITGEEMYRRINTDVTNYTRVSAIDLVIWKKYLNKEINIIYIDEENLSPVILEIIYDYIIENQGKVGICNFIYDNNYYTNLISNFFIVQNDLKHKAFDLTRINYVESIKQIMKKVLWLNLNDENVNYLDYILDNSTNRIVIIDDFDTFLKETKYSFDEVISKIKKSNAKFIIFSKIENKDKYNTKGIIISSEEKDEKVVNLLVEKDDKTTKLKYDKQTHKRINVLD